MSGSRALASLAAVAFAVFAVPAAALAQGTGGDPGGRALFGSARGDGGRQALNLTFSLAEAWDSDALADTRPSVTPGTRQAPGYHTTLLSTADYRAQASRAVTLAGSAASTFRYYNELSEVRSVSHSGGFGMSADLPSRWTLRVDGTAAYSPSYLYGLFPTAVPGELGEAPAAAPDYALDVSESYTYGAASQAGREIGRRGRLSLSGDYGYTDYTREDAGRRDMERKAAGGTFSYGLSRNLSLTTGYRLTSGAFGYVTDATAMEHRVDVGTAYTRQLSANRRAGVRFSVGASAMDVPEGTSAVASGAKYQVVGDLALDLQFARGWRTTGSLRRGVEYMPALTEPVFINGVSAGIDGLIGRRVNVSAAAGYANGESILNQGGSGFGTYTGNARVQVAASRTIAFFGEYLYYFYDFREQTQLAPGIPLSLERNGIRGGIVLWVPAIGR